MPKLESISVRVCREAFTTPIKSDSIAVSACKPLIFLPIQSKRSPEYTPSFVQRTTSTDSTEASMSPQNNEVNEKVDSRKEQMPESSSSGRLITFSESKHRVSPPKTVSWASVSHVNVVSTDDSHSAKNDVEPNLAQFVERLRRSPKHADTIYVYQSTSFMDFDDKDEDISDYRFFSSLPQDVGIHSIPLTSCESSN